MPGTLFIVATPIGNLDDITLRALRVLSEVAVIAAEDTRRTAGLLAHFRIQTPTMSFHAHNEHHRGVELLGLLETGKDLALVSDAGTPLVSDPGQALVRAARAAGIRVEVVPGPSAALAALVASGLASDTFTFLGFPPRREGARRSWIRSLAAEPRTTVFYEAPHRIAATLTALAEWLPDRMIAVARELTKVHEEVVCGPAAEVLTRLGEPRGEFTVVVAPPAPEDGAAEMPASDADLWREFAVLTGTDGVRRREAIATLARRHGRPARDIYAAVERGKRDSSEPLEPPEPSEPNP
jgi:16S rRNA (cytidine1402-2'-O)-methyltransferase